jgi:hypothetical protein
LTHSETRKKIRKRRKFTLQVNLSEGKIISVQAWTGAEGSRRLRLPDFKTIGS